MSLPKSAVRDVLTSYEKSDDLEEPEPTQSPDSRTPLESDPPDGGFQAWATVFGSFLIQFCGFGYVSSFGVYQDYYTRIYLTNYSPSAISWIGAFGTFLGDGLSLMSGPLYDRGCYHLMIAGSVLQSLSLFTLSIAKPNQFYLIFMVQGILGGIGMGLTFAPSMAVVSQHFSKRRTLALSLVAAGTPLGAVAHAIMINHLLNVDHVGFSKGVLASAGFVSSLLLIACLSMRTRTLPTPSGASYGVTTRKCSRDGLFILMIAGATLLQIGIYFPLFYLQLDSIKHGINVNFSFYSLVIMNAAAFIGRCTTGIIAPWMGVLNTAVVSSLACSALIISLIALNNIVNLIVICVVYGYFFGIFHSLSTPMIIVLTTDMSELGARMGVFLIFAATGGLIGSPISGALLSSQYRWLIPTLFSGLISLAGSLALAVLCLIMYRRKNGKYKVTGESAGTR